MFISHAKLQCTLVNLHYYSKIKLSFFYQILSFEIKKIVVSKLLNKFIFLCKILILKSFNSLTISSFNFENFKINLFFFTKF